MKKLFLPVGAKFKNKFSKNVSNINFCNNQLTSFHILYTRFYEHNAYKHMESEIWAWHCEKERIKELL